MLEFRTSAAMTPAEVPPPDYCNDATAIAAAVLKLYPTSHSVTFDTYEDDDTMDCGPLVDVDGRIVLSDVSDLEGGFQIEQIVSRWTYSEFLSSNNPCFTACPTTGRPQILVQSIAARAALPLPV